MKTKAMAEAIRTLLMLIVNVEEAVEHTKKLMECENKRNLEKSKYADNICNK